MQKVDFNHLKNFLKMSDKIPIVNEHVGFLDIIKKTTNETINSNIYAHFLSCDEEEIKQAFLDALIFIVNDKTKLKTQLSATEVYTEYSTRTGRIDIVIRDLVNQSHVLIENKIYHHLDNDLQEYWDYIKVSDSKKRGVVLTLSPQTIPNEVKDKFINITHLEWISKVKNLIDFSAIQKENYKVYLTDFFETIKQLTNTYTMNDSARFFFENTKQINAASHTRQEGHQFVNDQYNLIAEKLGLQTFGNKLEWKNFWDETNTIDTYFTIVAENILTGKELTYSIIIELYREDIYRIDDLDAKFKAHNQFIKLHKGGPHNKFYHYLIKEYKITIEELANFSDHVVYNIQNDFGQLFVDMVKYLHPSKDISAWEYNVANFKSRA